MNASAAETVPLSDFIARHSEESQSPDQTLPRMLSAIRKHLGMDVAFTSEFTDGHRVFRHVDSANTDSPVKAGASDPLEESYCQRVVDGRLPELINDAGRLPVARELSVTTELPVGAHLSVPIKLSDGTIYGTFCCFSFTPDESLNERDLNIMRVFAELAGEQIERDVESRNAQTEIETRINAVVAGEGLSMVYQPIYELEQHTIAGFESLARFSAMPSRTPDVWFNEAAQVGLNKSLETSAVKQALKAFEHLPPDVYLSINASPESILEGDMASVLDGWPLERLVLEVTEHSAIEHYADLATGLDPLRARGLRLAIDDAGAGYASFRHILNLSPDLIKLDNTITRDIDTRRSQRALAAALVTFAREVDSQIIAEGVETDSELSVLQQLQVHYGQGYLLGKPMPLQG